MLTVFTHYYSQCCILPATVGTSPSAGGAGAYIGGGRKTPLRVGWGMGATASENEKETYWYCYKIILIFYLTEKNKSFKIDDFASHIFILHFLNYCILC